MGHTKKRNYDRYTLAYKLQAVKLANHPDVEAVEKLNKTTFYWGSRVSMG